MNSDFSTVFKLVTSDTSQDSFIEGFKAFLQEGHFVGNEGCRHNIGLKQDLQALGYKNPVTCASGTDALAGALFAIGVGQGDEVIVPALSWLSTATVVRNVGAIPVYCDVDDRGLVRVDEVRAKISPSTKAIIAVHLYGNLVDVSAIQGFTDLPIIEDCAQAFGSFAKSGEYAGNLGDIGCFSFFPTKNLGAIGDAGFTTSSDAVYASKMAQYFKLGQGKTKGSVRSLGINSRLDSIQAYVLRFKLKEISIEQQAAQRREIISAYKAANFPVIDCDRNAFPHLAIARYADRAASRKQLSENGIATMIHYDFALSDVGALEGRFSGECKNATKMATEVVTLPLHPDIAIADIHRLAI